MKQVTVTPEIAKRGSQVRKDYAAILLRKRKNGKSLNWGKPRIYRDPRGLYVSYNFVPWLYGHTWTVTVPRLGCPMEFA